MRFEHYLVWKFKRLKSKFKNTPNQVIHLVSILIKVTLSFSFIGHIIETIYEKLIDFNFITKKCIITVL